MGNLTTMTRSQLTDFVETFERNAFNWTAGAQYTARDIEDALKSGDTANVIPTVTPSTLTGRPLTEDEFKELLYSAVHDVYADIEARDTINAGGTSPLTPIIPDYYDENELTDMWVEDYRKANGYEYMSDHGQAVFDEKTGEFLEDHALYVVDLDSELGSLLDAFGWDKSQTAFYAFAVRYAYYNFLIVPENGANVENILFAEPEEATRFYEFALRKGITVNIDNRVNPDDFDVEVVGGFAVAYASLNNIELSDSVLGILADKATDNAELFALPLDSAEGRALATLWGIPARPSFADNLALYKAHEVIALNGNVYSMKQMSLNMRRQCRNSTSRKPNSHRGGGNPSTRHINHPSHPFQRPSHTLTIAIH